MIAWYNYITIVTFEGLKQPLGLKQPQELKQPILVSTQWRSTTNCFKLFQIVSSCFKLFQVFQIFISSGQQPACLPMIIICFINKVGDQVNT